MKNFFFGSLILTGSLLFAQTDDLDSLFDDPGSSVIEEAAVVENPEASVFGGNSFQWAGDFSSSLGVSGSYVKLPPTADELADPTERLSVDIGARLWFDARPDKNYRVFGKFTTDYPFGTQIKSLADPALAHNPETNAVQAYSLNNIKLYELFSDFNWKEKVFFRFGKQTAGWGLSRFYQIADPLTVGVKDPTDPSADLEGPMALKVALPLGVNNLYVYTVVKESYLPKNIGEASVRDVGAGLKADFLIPVPKNKVFGNADFTVGAYAQRHLAPKAVAGLSTSVGDFQIFTDQAISWGLDSYRLTDEKTFYDPDGTLGPAGLDSFVYNTEKPDDALFYSATLGTMYVNNDKHFTLYGEYMFNSASSGDEEYLDKWLSRYGGEMNPMTGAAATLSFSDAFGYLSAHNSGLSLSWSEIFGTDKLGFSALWLQNWVDLSGMAKPTVTFKPFDHLSFETGVTCVWGKDRSEWVIKNTDPVSRDPKRLTGFVSVKLGGGKF